MEPLDLTEFEWNINVRQLTLDDYDALVAMAERCFPGMEPWSRDQIESQLSIFPEGQLCVEIDGRLLMAETGIVKLSICVSLMANGLSAGVSTSSTPAALK